MVEFDRRVQIRVDRLEEGKRKRGFGSGYLIAPRLVLTAAHVIGDASGPGPGTLMVSRPQPASLTGPGTADAAQAGPDSTPFPATVRWYRKSELVDAALIEIDDGHGWQTPQSLQDIATRPPQRWGLLIGPRPHHVTVLGFPSMQKDAAHKQRLDEQLTGEIHPGNGSLAHHYEISSTNPTLTAILAPDTPGTRWSGISGAAVHADDLLCGIIRRDRQATGGSRLTATPTALLLADDAFRTVVTEHTSGWEPTLEPVEPAALLNPAAPGRGLSSPASLLRADTEAVTFHGREHELADLRTWCETGSPALSLRVLTGPGGQGKSRLARHLTHLLGHAGWATGFLRSDLTDHDPPPVFAPLTTALPLLLVVDYAETRPRLLRRLITHLHRSRHRVRLLLLARSDGEWRTDALSAAPPTRDLLRAAHITPLAALMPLRRPGRGKPDQDRTSAFTRAAADLARLLPLVPSLPAYDWQTLAATLRPSDDLNNDRYDNALTLQMTALVSLLQQGPARVHATPSAPAEEILLEHEERFWEESADAPAFKLNLPTPTLAVAVAVAALCGAADKDEALRIIGKVPELPPEKAPRTAAWLAGLYPVGPGRYWGSLQPDRIGEYLASRTLANASISLPALLTAATPGQQAQLVIVLARAVVAHSNAERTTNSERTLQALITTLDTVSLAHQALWTAIAGIPFPSRITAPIALRLTSLLVHANQQLAADNPAAYGPDLATSLSAHAVQLAEAGRLAEGLTAEQQAVKIRRRLAADDPATYEPDLGNSLINLGKHLAEAGQPAEALAAGQEAVKIHRRLAADNPAANDPSLAASLSLLGNQLAEMGQPAEALKATQEAVKIHRRLAADNPAIREPGLAASLSDLGIQLAEVGQPAEGLTAEQQAVKIRRRLAADNPAAHEPDLARSLSNLGNRLMEVEQPTKALTATRDAVKIHRRLAMDNPAKYEPGLAHSLSNLGIQLAEAGQPAEGLTAEQQAVKIRRRLAADNPAAHEPDLARSLSNLGKHLANAGQPTEALNATRDAVKIHRRLTADNPAAHEPDFARSLSNLVDRLIEAEQPIYFEEALNTLQETVEIRRRLATASPATHEPGFAASLGGLGILLAGLEQSAEALNATQEAVKIHRRLATDNPAKYEPSLAASLRFLGKRLADVEQHAEALAAGQEAVATFRRLVQADPATYEAHLGQTLYDTAFYLWNMGRHEEACSGLQQSVEIFRGLAAGAPEVFTEQLRYAVEALAEALEALGRTKEAKQIRHEFS